MVVAMAVGYACYRLTLIGSPMFGWLDVGFIFLEVVFFRTGRDNLWKYQTRSAQVLGLNEAAKAAPTPGGRRARIRGGA